MFSDSIHQAIMTLIKGYRENREYKHKDEVAKSLFHLYKTFFLLGIDRGLLVEMLSDEEIRCHVEYRLLYY
jgi:hypothetical protein